MSKPHFRKSRGSFCASLMTISMIVLAIHCAWPRRASSSADKRSRRSGSVAAASAASLSGMSAWSRASRAFQRGSMRWNIRAQVILSMHTSIDLPVCQRVEQCSTKSSASLSSRSSAVITS